tara:strand:- start:3611 stop:4513 length:903 start_codon:yes stop_codon:yes gene_type:complete
MVSDTQEGGILTRSFRAMGSDCEFQLCFGGGSDSQFIFKCLQDELERLESKYSKFRKDSLLSQINLGKEVNIDNETISLLEHAFNCFEQSEGLFDVTAGRLNSLWDFKKKKVPSQEEISYALSVTDFSKVSWNNGILSMPAGMNIDFGGIVKEYAADTLAVLAKKFGVQYGLINLGGDIAIVGNKPDGIAWKVGITDPRGTETEIASIDIYSGGLATSGDYKRYFIYEGKRYSHILNPKTGFPCAGLRAVSVAANLCTVAGSIATIAMLKDEPEAIKWLNDLEVPFVAMDSNLSMLRNSD